MIYSIIELAPHPTDVTRRAFKIVVSESPLGTPLHKGYGVYDTPEEMMQALEPLLNMEASK